MRFEIPCLLALSCAVLAADGLWTLERFESHDCADSNKQSMIGDEDANNDKCRPIYGDTEGSDRPSIRSIKLSWDGDYEARVYWDGEECHRGSYKEVVNGECTEAPPNLRAGGDEYKIFESFHFM